MWVIQSGNHMDFTLESVGELRVRELDGYEAIEARITRFPDLRRGSSASDGSLRRPSPVAKTRVGHCHVPYLLS